MVPLIPVLDSRFSIKASMSSDLLPRFAVKIVLTIYFGTNPSGASSTGLIDSKMLVSTDWHFDAVSSHRVVAVSLVRKLSWNSSAASKESNLIVLITFTPLPKGWGDVSAVVTFPGRP